MSISSQPTNLTPKQILRNEILEAIRESEKYWLMYQEEAYGIAGFMELPYKKMYIEILFYPPGHEYFPFQLHAVGNTTLDFTNLHEKYQKAANFHPSQVLNDLELLVNQQSKQLLRNLDAQLSKVKRDYFLLPSAEDKYVFELRFYYSKGDLPLLIDLRKYPKVPDIRITINDLTKKRFGTTLHTLDKNVTATLQNWNIWNPPPLNEIFRMLDSEIGKLLGEADFSTRREFNNVKVENVTVGYDIKDISFILHRGQHLGIYSPKADGIEALFRVLAQQTKSYTGLISLFGVDLLNQTGPITSIRNNSIWINHVFSPQDLKRSIGSMIPRNNPLRKQAWAATFLEFDLKKKLQECSPLEQLRVLMAIGLSQSPGVILVRILEEDLGKMDTNQVQRILRKIKESFDTIFIIHAPQEIVEVCDQILPISESGAAEQAGTLEDLSDQMPQSGEIITIQLTNPTPEQLQLLRSIPNTEIVEIRPREKFKLFSLEDPDKLTIRLFKQFGSTIYNFQRQKPTLGEYIEFLQNQGKSIVLNKT